MADAPFDDAIIINDLIGFSVRGYIKESDETVPARVTAGRHLQ